MITVPEINDVMKTLTLLVDTREQPTEQFERRMKTVGIPYKRQKLDFGDYSASVVVDGQEIDFSGSFAIERKMSIDEIATNLTRHRDRFKREFDRAKDKGAKMYVLIEGATWEKVLRGDYRTKVHPNSLFSSLFAWQCRYGCQIVMCDRTSTPIILREICKREVKRLLEEMAVSEM